MRILKQTTLVTIASALIATSFIPAAMAIDAALTQVKTLPMLPWVWGRRVRAFILTVTG